MFSLIYPEEAPNTLKACLTVMRLFIYQAANVRSEGEALNCVMWYNLLHTAAFKDKSRGMKKA